MRESSIEPSFYEWQFATLFLFFCLNLVDTGLHKWYYVNNKTQKGELL
jgi:hypothetical protein